MYKIFLDDIRYPINAYDYTYLEIYKNSDWIIVRNYDEFIKTIKNIGIDNIDIISFDHDLSDEHYQHLFNYNEVDYDNYKEKTGYECVKWLCDYCIDNNQKLPDCIFHTQNPIGYKNMSKYIENFRKFYE